MWCEMMTGLNFFFFAPAFSLSREEGGCEEGEEGEEGEGEDCEWSRLVKL